GRGIFQLRNDLFAGGFFFEGQEGAERIVIGHVRRDAVHDHAHLHDRAGESDFVAKNLCAVGRRKDGLADIEPDFAAVDIESGHDLDIPRPVGGDLAVHQADGAAVDPGAAVEVDSLDERTGAITDSDDGDTDLSHGKKEILPAALRLGQDV